MRRLPERHLLESLSRYEVVCVCFHSEPCFRESLDEINILQQMQLMQKIVPTTNQPVMLFFFHFRLTATARRQSTRSVCHGWRTTKSVSSSRSVSTALHCSPETAEQSVVDEPPSCAFLVITATQKADSSVCHPQNTTVCVFQKLLEVCLTDGGCLPLVQIFSTCLNSGPRGKVDGFFGGNS